MSLGDIITVRNEQKTHFCSAYNQFIVEYVRTGVTVKEAAKLSELHGVATVSGSNVSGLVTSLRNTDEKGWPLHKCCFVEKYLMSSAPLDTSTVTLCQVDNDVLSGLRFYCGIPMAPYRNLVMGYVLSGAEEEHCATLCVLAQMSFEQRIVLLAALGGIDDMGWLHTKNSFLKKYADYSAQSDNQVTIILEVLHKVRAVFEQHIAIAPCSQIA